MAKSAKQNSLAAIPGALVLVGAGKMGSAMLKGWLDRKLPPKKVIVLEPQPSKAIKALAKRGQLPSQGLNLSLTALQSESQGVRLLLQAVPHQCRSAQVLGELAGSGALFTQAKDGVPDLWGACGRRGCNYLNRGIRLSHLAFERQVPHVGEERLQVVGDLLLGFKPLGICGLKVVPLLEQTEPDRSDGLPTVQQHGRSGLGTPEGVRQPSCSFFNCGL